MKQNNNFKQIKKNPSTLLPLQFGEFIVKKLQWSDFTGKIDQSLPFSAHIYWQIDYYIKQLEAKQISINLSVSNKSWAIQQTKTEQLLNHQQGHYLIGALCCLQFLKRVQQQKYGSFFQQNDFKNSLTKIFDITLSQYIIVEKQYDEQTDHYFNKKNQQLWDEYFYNRLLYYKQQMNIKVHKFGKVMSFLLKLKKMMA